MFLFRFSCYVKVVIILLLHNVYLKIFKIIFFKVNQVSLIHSVSHTYTIKMGFDFKAAMNGQQYKINTDADICSNCVFITKKQQGQQESAPARNVCSLGRFYVKPIGSCKKFEPKK